MIQLLILDDNQKLSEDSLVWELQDKFGIESVQFLTKPSEGLEYIKLNLNKNIIVLLDIDFPENEMNGHQILREIKQLSELIPVILWSGVDENKETFSDFINNHAFGFISKTSTIAEAMSIIDKAVAFLQTSLDNTIEDWIIANKNDKEKPIYLTSEGKSYSLNDILIEIRTQTDVGKDFSKKLNALTIDLLLRNKEKLND